MAINPRQSIPGGNKPGNNNTEQLVWQSRGFNTGNPNEYDPALAPTLSLEIRKIQQNVRKGGTMDYVLKQGGNSPALPKDVKKEPEKSRIQDETKKLVLEYVNCQIRKITPNLITDTNFVSRIQDSFLELLEEFSSTQQTWPTRYQLQLIMEELISAHQTNSTQWKKIFSISMNARADLDSNNSLQLRNLADFWIPWVTVEDMEEKIMPSVRKTLKSDQTFQSYIKLSRKLAPQLKETNSPELPPAQAFIDEAMAEELRIIHSYQTNSSYRREIGYMMKSSSDAICRKISEKMKPWNDYMMHSIGLAEKQKLKNLRPNTRKENSQPIMARFENVIGTGDTRKLNQYTRESGPRMADFNLATPKEENPKKRGFFRRLFNR